MDNILDIKDPRGKRIFLAKDTWENHILVGHPDLLHSLPEIIETIQKPFPGICSDRFDPDCQIYYGKFKHYYLRIVVRFSEKGNGFIMTAYEIFTPKSGDKIIWMN
jgi:hypothetical protein